MKPALIFLTAITLLLAACGDEPAASEAEVCLAPVDGVITLTAEDLVFNANCLELPAGEEVSIAFTNLDTEAHNLAIYTDDSTDTQLWIGDIISGGESVDYTVPALDAGTYYFECNVHPAMNGVVRVS
jgi:plastocyanin